MAKPRAILLDLYGTVVEETKAPVMLVCEEVARASSKAIKLDEVVFYWWDTFGKLFTNSYGETFRYEKQLGQEALLEVIQHFNAHLDNRKIVQALSRYWDEYWGKPEIFPESRDVLAELAELGVPVCLVSNIDNAVLDSDF